MKNQITDTERTVYFIIITIWFVHLFNDMMQSIIPAIYSILKENP